jgi:hypothetical protein
MCVINYKILIADSMNSKVHTFVLISIKTLKQI